MSLQAAETAQRWCCDGRCLDAIVPAIMLKLDCAGLAYLHFSVFVRGDNLTNR
jgi:hypothetical protein